MSGQRRRPVRVPEAAGLEQGRGHRAAPEQEVLQAGPQRAVQLDVVVVGVVAACIPRSRRRRDGPGGSRRRPAGRATTGDADRRRWSAGPMPDSSSRRGEPMPPEVTSTSRSQRRIVGRPPLSTTSTPTARPPSTTMRVTSASVRTVRLGRCADRLQIGRRRPRSGARCAPSPGSGRCRPASRR